MNTNFGQPTPPPLRQVSVVEQTNSVMKRVYVRMFIGMLVTAFCALGVASSPALAAAIFGNKLIFWGSAILMLVMAIAIPSGMNKWSSGTILALFLVYSALMGVWIAPIFYVYTLGSIAYVFFITAGMFGAMSVYGYFTKANLAKFGSICLMALFGVIIAIIVNMFLKSSMLDFGISIIAVLLFAGLTAWDTQSIKALSAANLDPAMADKLATMGAMNLYLDFINMFLYLLRLFGNRD